jgi:oxygen-independent coproporphyrinogen-3 oxidase
VLGLYLHIPFCSSICNYCNFNRGLYDAELKTRYVEALIAEIRSTAAERCGAGGEPEPADTIYFGGGTPSLLEPDEIGRIVATCRASFALAGDCEVTIEANPDSVDEPRLGLYRQAGVNRVSFGVQSFRDDELIRLSRRHDAARADLAIQDARRAGFANVSLDLMMWLPGQSVAEWLASVDRALAADPAHVSLYMLEVYPNAPLRDEMARGRWSQAPDDDVAAMYATAMERFEWAGYPQYEISNVSRPGYRSRHNMKYWSDGDWIGFGCGAHSTCGGVRWKNVADTAEYVARIGSGRSAAIERRTLPADERLGDALFTGLRLTEGVDIEAVGERYGVNVLQRYGDALAPYFDEGILRREGDRLRLTRRGMLIAHEVMAVFV